jgi:uncharacterized protein (DUF1697 family)
MDVLRRLFGETGFNKGETFIAVGKVIFKSGTTSVVTIEQTIAAVLEAALAYLVATFIRPPAEGVATVAHTLRRAYGRTTVGTRVSGYSPCYLCWMILLLPVSQTEVAV